MHASDTRVLFVISTKDTCCPMAQEGPYFDTLTASGVRVLRTEWSHHVLYDYIILGGSGATVQSRRTMEIIAEVRRTLQPGYI